MEFSKTSSFLSDEIFYASKLDKKTIEDYKGFFIKEFEKQNNNTQHNLSELFYNATKCPFYFITKVIDAIKQTNQEISIKTFVDFIFELFTSPKVERRIELMFQIFNFNHDNIVNTEDIQFLFENLYMVKYKTKEYLEDLQKIFSSSSLRNCITKDMFISFITKENSDLFYLFFLFLREMNFCSKKYFEIFMKYNSSEVETDREHHREHYELVSPSLFLTTFAKEALNISNITVENGDDDDDNEDLQELDDFENHITSCIGDLEIEKRKSAKLSDQTSTSLKMLSSNNLIKFGLYSKSLEIPSVSVSCKNIINLKEGFNKRSLFHDSAISSFHMDLSQLYCEAKMRKVVKNEKNEPKYEKVKIIIKNKLIFLLKPKSKKRESYKLKAIYILNNIYASLDGETFDKPSGKNYYKLLLKSSTTQDKNRQMTLVSTSKDKIISILNLINKTNGFRDVKSLYTFEKEIAKGNFGTIFLATGNLTNRKVAVKQISKAIPNQAWIWEHDIFTLIQVNSNDYLVKCFDSFESASNIYLVYEYLPYGTLRTFLNESRTPGTYGKNLFALQLMTAVRHLHNLGIVHRDIKPDNLLVNYTKGTFIVKLIDFGLGKILGKNDTTNEPFGSLAYSAPEVVAENEYNYSPDIWSIGMIIYYLINEKDPFNEVQLKISDIQKLIANGDVRLLFSNTDKNSDFNILTKVMKMCLIKKNRPSIDILTYNVHELLNISNSNEDNNKTNYVISEL